MSEKRRLTSVGGALVPHSKRVSVTSGAACAKVDRLMTPAAQAPIASKVRFRCIGFLLETAGWNGRWMLPGCPGTVNARARGVWRALFLAERMQVAHQALEALVEHVGVDLRGRDVGMAEQRLHNAEIGAVLQEMARKGMAQHMRAQALGAQAGGDGEIFQFACRVLSGQVPGFAEGGKQPFR